MAELPHGTITFLFTDIEGSARLLKQLGERYRTARGDHKAPHSQPDAATPFEGREGELAEAAQAAVIAPPWDRRRVRMTAGRRLAHSPSRFLPSTDSSHSRHRHVT